MENLVMIQFNDIYRNKKVFITGHTGFKGSWMSFWLIQLGANVTGYALAPSTNPSHFDELHLDMESIIGDIREPDHLSEAIHNANPDILFHMAAQPIVRESYQKPVVTFHTNVLGTTYVLEACRHAPNLKAIVNITTDKVYENKEWIWGYRENEALGGYDPYSTSKACSELVTRSYRRSFFSLNTYGKNHHCLVATARSGNVIGGGDWSVDRLIPDIIKATAKNETTVIRSPQSIRPWQHVLEPLAGYLILGCRLLQGQAQYATAWNFGPDLRDAIPVEEVAKQMQNHWPQIQTKALTNGNAPHEASILKLDSTQAHSQLGWYPIWNSKESIRQTAEWYRVFYEDNTLLTEQQLNSYIGQAVELKSVWIDT